MENQIFCLRDLCAFHFQNREETENVSACLTAVSLHKRFYGDEEEFMPTPRIVIEEKEETMLLILLSSSLANLGTPSGARAGPK